MNNHPESFTHARPIYDKGFPTDTKGTFEITYQGKVHPGATIVDSYDPDAPGLCWKLPDGNTVQQELVSSSRKTG